jgi:hypothetical protein
MLLVALACAPSLKQLQTFKQRAAAGDYAWIAAQEVDCGAPAESGDPDQVEEGCNQLYLIKGDAHFRLAKEGVDSDKNYELAADYLEKGIKLTTTWQVDDLNLNRSQTYENLCEALRNFQDLRKGDEAAAVGKRYLKVAEEFLALEPNNPAAIFFVAQARFRKLQPEVIDPGERRDELLKELNKLITMVESALPGGRFEQNLKLLRGTLVTVRDAL